MGKLDGRNGTSATANHKERQMINDEVNNPKHYTSGSIECIDAIKAALSPEEFDGFLKGNILKYTWRERHKGGKQSMEKALWYMNRWLANKEMAQASVSIVKESGKPTTLAHALGLKEQANKADELDAYDQVEAHYFRREMM